MQLYDSIIQKWLSCTHLEGARELAVSNHYWKENAVAEMVLRGDSQFELGLDPFYGVGATAITSNQSFVDHDEIVLLGKDIPELTKGGNYGRLCIVLCKDDEAISEEKLYNYVSAIDYVRYHVNPQGVMIRVSKTNNKEGIRISKQAFQQGFSFGDLGNLFLKQFHKNSTILAVKIIFISLDDFNYADLKSDILRSINITKALDHMMQGINMDCHTCNLQPICEEVEGLKEMHFGISNQSNSK